MKGLEMGLHQKNDVDDLAGLKRLYQNDILRLKRQQA